MLLSNWESLQRIMTFRTTLERLTIKKTYSKQLRMLMMADQVSLITFGGGQEDLILAFFPCIYFCDSNNLYFQDTCCNLDRQYGEDNSARYQHIIERSRLRQEFYELLWKLIGLAKCRGLRLIIENPWNTNGLTYLQRNFIKPSLIDRNRMLRGDYFVKPTAYWFINTEPTHGRTEQKDKKQRKIRTGSIKEGVRGKSSGKAGICSEDRSMISPDYARNFICDFVIGKDQIGSCLSLF